MKPTVAKFFIAAVLIFSLALIVTMTLLLTKREVDIEENKAVQRKVKIK